MPDPGIREWPIFGGIYRSQSRPRLRIREGGVATVPQSHGVLVLWYEDHQKIILKEKGHREGYNQYNPPFKIPTQFHVFAKRMLEEPGMRVEVVDSLGEFPLNQQKEG